MFFSTAATIKDDAGDQLGVGEDFDKEVYKELIELYSSPADWVINVQLATGRVVKIWVYCYSSGAKHNFDPYCRIGLPCLEYAWGCPRKNLDEIAMNFGIRCLPSLREILHDSNQKFNTFLVKPQKFLTLQTIIFLLRGISEISDPST